MLYFDDDSVGGNASPPDGGFTRITSPLTYHGLTFSTPADRQYDIVNQNLEFSTGFGKNTGLVSSPANNLLTDASTPALATLTVSTGGNGAIKVISLFVSQPATSGQSITITGSLMGVDSPGCSGTFTPADGVGAAVQFSACFADTLVLTGTSMAQPNAGFLVGIDTLMACAATIKSALTAAP